MAPIDRPLTGLHVVDLVDGPLAPITRYYAELGAQVDRFVPVTGDAADFAANAGKRQHADCMDGFFQQQICNADVIVANAAGHGLDIDNLRTRNPALVVMLVSDFGIGNSFSEWQATDAVLHALSGELSRSGIRGREPLLPPGQLAYQCAASQAAFLLLSSYFHALRSGRGDLLDFAALDGAVQALDPGFGINGSATMGRPANLLSRDRPAKGVQYPIFPCSDGHVRLCLLSPKQWQGMFRWMGEPPEFAASEFNKISTRQQSTELNSTLARFFQSKMRSDVESEGQTHGVPITALRTFEEFAVSEHISHRHALVEYTSQNGTRARVPNGILSIDGNRMGPIKLEADQSLCLKPGTTPLDRPFAGLRVLDLGIIVAGAEAGRMLADRGADVIKVESEEFPDGCRQSYLPYGMSVSFAAGHRNKRSLGINLRDPEGRELFLDLASKADVILSNFKPGTMEALGLSYSEVAAVNPRIIMADSSAFGQTGPWAKRMGYGPLVRAATGLTGKWRYADDAESFSDSVTIYPDHVAGRITALGVAALLIRRERTQLGGTASVSQAEVMLSHFGPEIAAQDMPHTSALPDALSGVYRTAGEDEWCVITIRHDADWQALASLVADSRLNADWFTTAPLRRHNRANLDTLIGEWMQNQEADLAMAALQNLGVPAAKMLRVADLPEFKYFKERQLLRVEKHPWLDEIVISEKMPMHGEKICEAPLHPAPLAGEQTVEIATEWLDRNEPVLVTLAEKGILQPTAQEVFATIHRYRQQKT